MLEQVMIDFDAPAVNAPPPPKVNNLTLSLNTGETLGKALEAVAKETEHVTLTPQGIYPTDVNPYHHHSEMIPYRKGVGVQ